MTQRATVHHRPNHSSPSSSAQRAKGPWHRRIPGLHVLKLKGSHYEMGRQHGEMLADEIRRGPIPYYRTYLERMMGRSGLGAVTPVAWSLAQQLVGTRVRAGLPGYALEAITGMAQGAGLDLRQTLQGCTMPDTLLWVASRMMQLRGVGPAVHHRLALGMGCTSAIAHGEATADGKLLHARNFDYHGVECWPRSTAVVFHEPDEGLRYVSIGAAGVLLGGVTAMNEAGLTLTVHQHMFTSRTKLGGMPAGVIGDRVMREARNLDEAEEILRAHRPIGCWTNLITDGKRREVLCWEENPERQVAMRFSADDETSPTNTFGYANIYLDEQLGETELNLYPSYWRHNLGRMRRVNALLAKHNGTIDADRMAAFLGDEGEGNCRIATSIGMLMTVGSVVFRPEDGVFWVGAGEAPTSQRGFVPFDLQGERHAPEQGTLGGGICHDAESSEAFASYRQAYVAYLDHNDTGQALRLMQHACELQPDQPLYQCLSGLLALQQGDGRTAFAAFSRALEIGHEHPERLAQFHLWRARAADLNELRTDSCRDYRAALGQPADPAVARAAQAGLRQAFSLRRAKRIDIDFTYADVVTP